jgi:ribosomal protein L7/L12
MPELTPEQREQVERAMAEDRKIEAIKLYREFTGAGLAEAKDAVERMEGSGHDDAPPSETGAAAVQRIEPELRQLLREGRKIEAIKRFREATGLGLKESKDAVEALEREMPGAKKSGCTGVLLLPLLCLLATGYRLLK